MTVKTIYTQTVRRQKFYFAFVFINCSNLWRLVFTNEKCSISNLNKPSWPQITAFWRATQLRRKFVFWQQIIAIVTTHKNSFSIYFRTLCFPLIPFSICNLHKDASSETQGLLAGTMRYFRAEVYFKSWRVSEVVKFRPLIDQKNIFLANQRGVLAG